MPERRAQVWAKTNGYCWYCGKLTNPWEDFTEEHMDPRANGGGDELTNLVPACKRCNSRKHDKNVEEYRTYLAGKGKLTFWGELPTTGEMVEAEEDEDEDDYERYCPTLDAYSLMVRACFYIGRRKTGYLEILTVFMQIIDSWRRGYTADGTEYPIGKGVFSLKRLSSTVGMSQISILLAVIELNDLGIITSTSYRADENSIYFYLNTMKLHNLAKAILEP